MRSSTSSPVSGNQSNRAQTLALWTGTLAGPLLFLLALQVNYTLSYVACETRTTWFLHATTAISVILIAASGLWAWRSGREWTDLPGGTTEPVGIDTHATRVHWMTMLAVTSAVWFVIATIALGVPAIVFRPCQ
jgi:hypothetical protein